MAPNVSVEEVRGKTGCSFDVADSLAVMDVT